MTRSRTGLSPVAVLVLAIALAGCSSGSDAPEAAASPGATASTPAPPGSDPAAPAPSGSAAAAPCDTSGASLTGPAADKFGADAVTDAFCTYSGLVGGWAFDDVLVRESEDQATAAEFADVRDYLTPAARRDWDRSVSRSLAGDSDAFSSVYALKFFNLLNGSPYAFADAPAFGDVEVSGVTTGVDQSQDDARLVLTLTVSGVANLVTKAAQEPYTTTASKDLTLYLSPVQPTATGTSWSIGGFSSTFDLAEPMPR